MPIPASRLKTLASPSWWIDRHLLKRAITKSQALSGKNKQFVPRKLSYMLNQYDSTTVWQSLSEEEIGFLVGPHRFLDECIFDIERSLAGYLSLDQKQNQATLVFYALKNAMASPSQYSMFSAFSHQALADGATMFVEVAKLETSHTLTGPTTQQQKEIAQRTLRNLHQLLRHPAIAQAIARNTECQLHHQVQTMLAEASNHSRSTLLEAYTSNIYSAAQRNKRIPTILFDIGELEPLFTKNEVGLAILKTISRPNWLHYCRQEYNPKYIYQKHIDLGAKEIFWMVKLYEDATKLKEDSPFRHELEKTMAWWGVPNTQNHFSDNNNADDPEKKRGHYYWTDASKYTEEHQWLAMVSFELAHDTVPSQMIASCTPKLQTWHSLGLHTQMAKNLKEIDPALAIERCLEETRALMQKTPIPTLELPSLH